MTFFVLFFLKESRLPQESDKCVSSFIYISRHDQYGKSPSYDTNLSDLLCSSEAVFLKVIGQVQEGASLQVLAVTKDDQETLLLHTNQNAQI